MPFRADVMPTEGRHLNHPVIPTVRHDLGANLQHRLRVLRTPKRGVALEPHVHRPADGALDRTTADRQALLTTRGPIGNKRYALRLRGPESMKVHCRDLGDRVRPQQRSVDRRFGLLGHLPRFVMHEDRDQLRFSPVGFIASSASPFAPTRAVLDRQAVGVERFSPCRLFLRFSPYHTDRQFAEPL